jgi:L-asparaginase/Glu-tRNA(Gln) amidotransferase subunit D
MDGDERIGEFSLDEVPLLACTPQSRGKGVLVAFNGEINAGRDVTKTNTYHLQTFRTCDLGLLGYIDPDKIEFYRTPHRRHTLDSEFSLSDAKSLPYVEVAYIHTGTRPGLADAMVRLGAKGIVIASVGAGSPGSLDEELTDILQKRSAVIVQSSRVGEGRIVRNNNWWKSGMVVADRLNLSSGRTNGSPRMQRACLSEKRGASAVPQSSMFVPALPEYLSARRIKPRGTLPNLVLQLSR